MGTLAYTYSIYNLTSLFIYLMVTGYCMMIENIVLSNLPFLAKNT